MAKKTALKKDGKKDMVEKTIIRNIPEITYIKQPYNLTFMRGDLSNMQLSAIIEVMDHLQDRVDQYLGKDQNQRELQPGLFSSEEVETDSIPPIRIPLSSLGVLPQYYDRLEAAVASMTTQVLEYNTTKDGQPSKVYAPLFKSIAIPRREVVAGKAIGGKVEEPSKHMPRRGSFIEINLNPEIVPYMFDMRRYNKYIKEVARNCSLYTSRIYMCITAKKFHQTGTWEISYPEFRQIMGADKYDSTKREWVTAKYPVYTDFRKRVLNDAMKELKELEERGEVDCYFTYEEIFPGGVRRGNPDRLRFFIHVTEMGKLEQTKTDNSRNRIEIQDYMRQNFRMSMTDAHKILRMLEDEDLEKMKEKMRSLKQYLDEHMGKIENPKAYAITALTEWAKDLIPFVPEVQSGPAPEKQTVTPEPAQPETPADDSSAPLQEGNERWMQCLDIIQGLITAKDYTTYFPYIEVMEYSPDRNQLVLLAPSSLFVDTMMDRFAQPILQAVQQAFPAETQIYWKTK